MVYPTSYIHYFMKQNIIFSHLKIFLELKLPRKIKFVPKASKIDKAIKPLFLAHNIIKCSTYKKPKWFFSNGKLNQPDIYLCKKLKMKVFPLAKIRFFCQTTNDSQPLFWRGVFHVKSHTWKSFTILPKKWRMSLFFSTVEVTNLIYATMRL